MHDAAPLPPAEAEPDLIITSVTYGRTIQPRPFESKRLEATADVPPGADPHQVTARLCAFIETELGLRPPPLAPGLAPPADDADPLDDIPF